MIFEQEKTHALPSRDVSIVGSSLKPAAKANSISQTRYKWSDIFIYKWPNLPNGAFTGLVIQKIHGKSRLFNNGILIFMVYEIIPKWLGQLFSPRTSEVIHFCPGPWNNWRLSGPFFGGILSPWNSSAPGSLEPQFQGCPTNQLRSQPVTTWEIWSNQLNPRHCGSSGRRLGWRVSGMLLQKLLKLIFWTLLVLLYTMVSC